LNLRYLVLLLAASVFAAGAAEPLPDARIVRVFPLGAQRGTTATVEILGEYLSNAKTVEFASRDLVWAETLHAASGKLKGRVRIAGDAPLGPHRLRVLTAEGYSSSALFNVGQFADVAEIEPNDSLRQAQAAPEGPIEIQGLLDGAPDTDIYAIEVQAGERWNIDFRGAGYGSAVECKMYLLDAAGERVAFNDDRSDHDDLPLIDRTFEQDGLFYVKLDQYRGARASSFGRNVAYTLRISKLPAMRYVSPLGAQAGAVTQAEARGRGLETVEDVFLTRTRSGEYARMTYPHTMPIDFRPGPATAADLPRIEGRVVRRSAESVEFELSVPDDAEAGLWQLWAAGPEGIAGSLPFEISNWPEYGEDELARAAPEGSYVVNGALATEREKDVYRVEGRTGRPLHFWTLAMQLDAPLLDTVLTLRSAAGEKLADSDDVVAGRGPLIGNLDSSLFYTPREDGPLFLEVKDRIDRGGPSFVYRLKAAEEEPGFQLFTTPEHLNIVQGGRAALRVNMAREEGFAGEVEVWFEDLPEGVEVPPQVFGAHQRFEPGADGVAMVIPGLEFQIRVPESLPPGTYAVRVFGVAVSEKATPDRRIVEAHSNLVMGPLRDLWNFFRRPVPRIEFTVLEPFEPRISASPPSLSLRRTGTVEMELTLKNLPEDADLQIRDLPEGVGYRLGGRREDKLTVYLEASEEAPLGEYDISAEARIDGRWAPSPPLRLKIQPAPRLQAGN